jgi:hypothetical protein
MKTDIVHIGGIPDNVHVSEAGIRFTGDLSYEHWEHLMTVLVKMETAFQWALGDAIKYGEGRYGEKYTQAMELTGHTYQSLANYSWVARNVPHHVRNPSLSWTHHRVVCKLAHDEQERLLKEAHAKEWSVDVLGDIVRGETLSKRVRDQVEVPPGLSLTDAKKILDSAACVNRDGVQVCQICPFKGR